MTILKKVFLSLILSLGLVNIVSATETYAGVEFGKKLGTYGTYTKGYSGFEVATEHGEFRQKIISTNTDKIVDLITLSNVYFGDDRLEKVEQLEKTFGKKYKFENKKTEKNMLNQTVNVLTYSNNGDQITLEHGIAGPEAIRIEIKFISKERIKMIEDEKLKKKEALNVKQKQNEDLFK